VGGERTRAQYGRPLAELRRSDESGFGGKSASLGELLAAGIPVPPGFALRTFAFDAFIEQAGLRSVIDEQLAVLSPDDVASVNAACATITEAIGSAPVPAEVEEEIVRGCGELAKLTGESEPPLAVRSSAIGEDSHTATFAGQQETFLWVRGAPGVVDAVRKCWASLYSTTAVVYRARTSANDPAPATPAMGVAIQVMVDALVSGVMFTCNPVSGDPSTIAVNASWGLGEAVVGGEVTPDEYLLSKVTGEVLRERIGEKLVEHVPAPEGGGTVRREVPPERRDCACLSETELGTLIELAGRVQRHFGGHQDIEWAIARTGSAPQNLFVLQSRPVTTMPTRHQKPTATSALALVMSTFGADRADRGSA
jgi:pyruvate,water dikinase